MALIDGRLATIQDFFIGIVQPNNRLVSQQRTEYAIPFQGR